MKPQRARILAMQAIFQMDFQKRPLKDLLLFDWIDYEIPNDEKVFAAELVKGAIENSDIINETIIQFSKNWDIRRISRVSKAIITISLYQLMFLKDEMPYKVVIDEAIRISKKYAEDDAGRFINGILDAYYWQDKK
ncbi:MAG: transcription antitermination factor NusB [Spirochaetia bacterium]|nr:transcription antitermination factor NusB [Spirochaetia bacterium]